MPNSTSNRFLLASVFLLGLATAPAPAHIVPPEALHPVAESYRRLEFFLNLNPVPWDQVAADSRRIAGELDRLGTEDPFAEALEDRLRALESERGSGAWDAGARRQAGAAILEEATRAVARTVVAELDAARTHLAEYSRAARHLETARRLWQAFEPAVAAAHPDEFVRLGECWLELASALGHPGLGGIGGVAPDEATFALETAEVSEYLAAHFTDTVRIPQMGRLAPLPGVELAAYSPGRMLAPGFNLNKQIPRPRQILNMATRGVDERDTPLVALGDMAFDSALIFGEPARSLAITCNTCHNKGVTNPQFFIPGLSRRPGGMDVSNGFFAAHANNGHFDPLDIPDLRGLRFTAPYGRNGRFDSLREFTRNVIVNEFSGPDPDPLLLDGLVAYMLEFDFLPNPYLEADGSLTAEAPEAAKRGEVLFLREYPGLGGRSCASCHVPSDHFLDRKRHDLGSVAGAESHSKDRALDTPTLLSSTYTAPYFHDGRFETLAEVVDWFDARFELGLSEEQASDLTAYLETIGDGVEAYEDTIHTLESELEEFDFFLSTYEFLKTRGNDVLIDVTFGTIAFEIRAHKWDVQDPENLPLLDRLAAMMDEARTAFAAGDVGTADTVVTEYRRLYRSNAEILR